MSLTDHVHPLTIGGFAIGGVTVLGVAAGIDLAVEFIFTFVATPLVIVGAYLKSRDGS